MSVTEQGKSGRPAGQGRAEEARAGADDGAPYTLWPWEQQKQCSICGKWHTVAAVCEQREAIEAFFILMRSRPSWAERGPLILCKDCCISPLGGHKCVWWSFCWGI